MFLYFLFLLLLLILQSIYTVWSYSQFWSAFNEIFTSGTCYINNHIVYTKILFSIVAESIIIILFKSNCHNNIWQAIHSFLLCAYGQVLLYVCVCVWFSIYFSHTLSTWTVFICGACELYISIKGILYVY